MTKQLDSKESELLVYLTAKRTLIAQLERFEPKMGGMLYLVDDEINRLKNQPQIRKVPDDMMRECTAFDQANSAVYADAQYRTHSAFSARLGNALANAVTSYLTIYAKHLNIMPVTAATLEQLVNQSYKSFLPTVNEAANYFNMFRDTELAQTARIREMMPNPSPKNLEFLGQYEQAIRLKHAQYLAAVCVAHQLSACNPEEIVKASNPSRN